MSIALKKLKKTKADEKIRSCLDAKQCFSVIAGAGSGKTLSLLTALKYLRMTEGVRLRRDDKAIACITYTNRAVDVISSRLDWDELFSVSTLHTFLWREIKRFNSDIRGALRDHVIPEHIEKKKDDDNGGNSKKAIAARAKVVTLQADLDNLCNVETFEYADSTFSDYRQGQLSHDDVVDVAAYLISHCEMLRQVIGQKYPYIFVDEAQDTFLDIVTALNKLCESDGLPLVGYFGDPMQQIYDKRAGKFAGPAGSAIITKEENFRSSPEVITLLNAFRKDIQQVPAGINAEYSGSVLLRLVASEDPELPRKRYSEDQIVRVSARFDEALQSWGWNSLENVKQLFLVRQMIARRLGFPDLQELFTGKYASSKAQDEYEKGDHFLLMPFIDLLCPLVRAKRDDDQKRSLDVLRKESPAFDPQGYNAERSLGEMIQQSTEVTQELSDIWGNSTLGDLLVFARTNSLCKIPARLSEHLDRPLRTEAYDPEVHSIDKGDWLFDEFVKMRTNEIEPFVDFVSENTPLSTQHGVKGEEYKNVVVVFDDIESAWNNYSFTKTLTPSTSGSPTDGQFDRSTKLAYVCFSRAEENLRILLFTPNPEAAKQELLDIGLFEESQISIAR